MDRLLSEGEIMATTGCFGISENYQKLIKAQLLKADKEWVEWIANIAYDCKNNTCKHKVACLESPFAASCEKWREGKKEMGYEC